MKVIFPNVIVLYTENNDREKILKRIEEVGRVCYKSEDKITDDSAARFVKKLIENGHESVLEHEKITVKIICDRGVSHELVRHRIASYSQESTRYCNYSLGKFGHELTFIKPYFWDKEDEEYKIWLETMQDIEKKYFKLIEMGAKPEEARAILPNSLKTEIIITMNLREWRHFLKVRTAKDAHIQMQEIANGILHLFQYICPVVFDDIKMTYLDKKKYRGILIDMQPTENETTLLFHYDSYIKMIEHKGIMLDQGWKCISIKENFDENLSKTGVAYYVEYQKDEKTRGSNGTRTVWI